MLLLANVVLILLAAALALPVAMFCLEVGLALLPRRKDELPVLVDGKCVAVLIPAHDEAAVLGATLETLMPTLPPGTRVLVVADNCHDATAEIARRHGAETIERQDTAKRGKGYALDFGIRHLAANPPDAVVFLDADCRVAQDTVRLLGAAAVATQRPVQGLNLCDPDPRGGAFQWMSGLAFRFKNLVRTVGLMRLAGLCHLTGTGMALPWPLVQRAQLADGNVVEDMQLGISLTLAGHRPLFLPAARVDSPLPQERSAARTQRTRWEHGHLATIARQSPRLFWLSIQHCRLELLWLALDLAIPPLSLLTSTLILAITAAAAWALLTGSTTPLVLLLFSGTLMGGAILAGWTAYCREQIPLRRLLAIPFYIAAKLPIYLAFFTKREHRWIRTQRDAARS
jgi:cellulose synthase/poly-beta-1,6-N-acetylglucosamine synthase-like glycosyltransferase